ncbi:MAG: hypothetical protein ACKJSG_07925 [Lentisphaeria bacterium]
MQDDPAPGFPLSDDRRRMSIDPTLQRVLFISGLVLTVVAVLMGLYSAIICCLAVGLIAIATPCVARVFQNLRVPPLVAHACVLIVAVAVALTFLLAYPAWQRQAVMFVVHAGELGDRVLGATESVDADLSGADHSAEFDQASETLSAHVSGIRERVDSFTRAGFGARFVFFLQFVAMLAGVLFMQLAIVSRLPARALPVGDSPPMAAERPQSLGHRLRIASLTRLIKALIIALLAGVGFAIAGLDTWFFIFGCVLVVALFTRLGPYVALILALLAVPTVASWSWSGAVALVTVIAMFAAEKRLHWYLVLVPAIRAGGLPREMYVGSRERRRRGIGFGWIFMFLKLLITAVVISALIYGGLFIANQLMSETEQDQLLNHAETIWRENPGAAVEDYEQLLALNPGNRKALMGLVRCHVGQEDFVAADARAEDVGQWPPTPSTPGSLREALDAKILLIYNKVTPPPVHDPAEGYRYVLEALDGRPEAGEFVAAAEKLAALEPESPQANWFAAQGNFMAENHDAAVTWATKGLTIDDRYPGLHAVLAKVHSQRGETAAARTACEAELAIDPDNAEMSVLLEELSEPSEPLEPLEPMEP